MYANIVMIHAAAMGTAVLLFAAREFLFIAACRGPIGAAEWALIVNKFAGLFIGVGIAGGIALVFLGSWSLLTPWLLTSFALIAILMVVENWFVRPWVTKLHLVLQGNSDKLEIQALLGNKRALGGRLATIGIFAVIVALMAVKPDLPDIFGVVA